MKSPMANKRVMNLGQKIFDRMEPSRLKEPFKEYHNQWKWWAQSKERSIAKANRVNTKSQIRKASKATTTSRIRRHIAWKATASTATRAADLTASSAKPKVNPTRADTTPPRRATKRLPPPQGQRQGQVAPLWPKIISRTFTKITNNEMRFWIKLIKWNDKCYENAISINLASLSIWRYLATQHLLHEHNLWIGDPPSSRMPSKLQAIQLRKKNIRSPSGSR